MFKKGQPGQAASFLRNVKKEVKGPRELKAESEKEGGLRWCGRWCDAGMKKV